MIFRKFTKESCIRSYISVGNKKVKLLLILICQGIKNELVIFFAFWQWIKSSIIKGNSQWNFLKHLELFTAVKMNYRWISVLPSFRLYVFLCHLLDCLEKKGLTIMYLKTMIRKNFGSPHHLYLFWIAMSYSLSTVKNRF